MAVSAPGGQVNPALMGALPPGANHHGHAMQHLNPTQQQMLQQHQQFQQCTSPHFHHPSLSDWPARPLILLVLTLIFLAVQNNPNTVAAIRQQQMLQQQQQARQMMAQQAFQNNLQQGGMPMTMGLNPTQIHQLRAQASRMGGPVRFYLCS